MSIVVDCSVAAAWAFEDERTAASEQLRQRVALRGGFAPAIWPTELTNVLRNGEKHGRIAPAATDAFIEAMLQSPVIVEPPPDADQARRVLALAREFKLTAYDAAYLELALRRGLPLATSDAQLAKAANAAGVAPL